MPKEKAEQFLLDDLVIDIPVTGLTAYLRERLENGQYEGPERALVRKLVRPGDRVLDLGAGAGVVAMVAARIVGAENVVAVEANPEMRQTIKRNFRRNGMEAIKLISAAVVARACKDDSVTFHVHPGFWSASLTRNEKLQAREVSVPVKRFPGLVRRAQASVVLMDVEGAEEQILVERMPDSVRLLIVELHPNLYGKAVIERIAKRMARGGFAVAERLKGDTVMAFARNVAEVRTSASDAETTKGDA